MIRAAAGIVAVLLLGGCGGSSKTYYMPAASMEPTIHCARPAIGCLAGRPDHVVVRTLSFAPRCGDIVAFHIPLLAQVKCGAEGVFIKRVIGLPGEHVAEHAGTIVVNGKPLTEPYVRSRYRDYQSHKAVAVPRASIWVLGDNRSASCDSRVWGPVPLKRVIGKAVEIQRGGSKIPLR